MNNIELRFKGDGESDAMKVSTFGELKVGDVVTVTSRKADFLLKTTWFERVATTAKGEDD